MIPAFDENGNLPSGVFAATLDEIENRFGVETELRRVEMQSLRWLVEIAKRAGISSMIVNGSFVCDIPDPNDVDCVLLLDHNYPRNELAGEELMEGLPFIEMYLVEAEDYNYFVQQLFANDRKGAPKGMLEVIL